MRLLWFTLCFFCWNCLCVVAAEHGAPPSDSHQGADTHASAEKESHSDSAAPAAENQHLAYYQLKITPEAASKDSAQPAALIKLECTDLSQLPEGNPILIWKQPDGGTEHLLMRPVLDGIWANRLELPTQPGEHELMLLACRAGAPASEALLAYRWKVKLPQLEIKPLEGALLFAEAEPSSKKVEPSAQDTKAAVPEKKVTRSWPLIALQLLLFNVLLAFGIGGMFVIYQRLPDRWLQRINGLPIVKLGAVEAIAAEHAAPAVQTPPAASPTVGASAPLPVTAPVAAVATASVSKFEKTEMLPPAGVDVDSTLSIINRLDEQLGGTEPSVQKAVETPAAETTPITPPTPPSPPVEQPMATAPAERESPNATPEEIDAWVKQMESQYGAEEEATPAAPAPVVAAAVASPAPPPPPAERESPNATPEEIDAWVKQMESQYGGVEEDETPTTSAEAPAPVVAAAVAPSLPEPAPAERESPNATPEEIDAWVKQMESQYGGVEEEEAPVAANTPPPPAEDPVASRLSAMERLLKEAEAQQQAAAAAPPVAVPEDANASPDDIDAIMRQLQGESVKPASPPPPPESPVAQVDAVASRLSAMERLLKEAEAQQQAAAAAPPVAASTPLPAAAPEDANASPDDIDAIMRQLQGESVKPASPPPPPESPVAQVDAVASRLSAMERLLKEAEAQQQAAAAVPPAVTPATTSAAAPEDANASPDDIDAIMRQLQGESVKPASPPFPAPAPVAAAPIEPAPALDAVASRLSAMERLLKEAEAQQQAAVAAVNPVPSQSEPPVAEELPDPVRAEPKPPPEPKASFISVGADDDDLKLDLDDLSF
jgi:hypothetical protein